jgi:hypothetical protein
MDFVAKQRSLESEIVEILKAPQLSMPDRILILLPFAHHSIFHSLKGRNDLICDSDASDCRIKLSRLIPNDIFHVTAVEVETTSAPLPPFLPDRFTIRVFSPGFFLSYSSLLHTPIRLYFFLIEFACR